MSKEMIISVNGREKKIAILDNGRVSEFYIERGDEENSGIVGNIYKGRVMRVLPGMQSAFVEIGLERDAFLYVSDFFDEEEEIERIVMEKSKKASPEELRREANDQIQKARLEREKQMEAVQDIAEPMIVETGSERSVEDDAFAESDEVSTAEKPAGKRDNQRDSQRGKSRRDKSEKEKPVIQPIFTEELQGGFTEEDFAEDFEEKFVEVSPSNTVEDSGASFEKSGDQAEDSEEADETPVFEAATLFEIEDSGFERIIDDEDTGEMFKDAYRQEAIVDKVRAVEFDMESAGTAEVGSLLDSVTNQPNGFERIADDDDEPAAVETPKAKTGRGSRGGRGKSKVAKEIETADGVESETAESIDSDLGNTNAEESAESAETEISEAARKTKAQASRKKNRGGKRTTKKDQLEDAEASVKESNGTAEMAVRRGGRNRRRPGEPERAGKPEGDENLQDGGDADEADAPAETARSTENARPVENTRPAENARPTENPRTNNYRNENSRDSNRNASSRSEGNRGETNRADSNRGENAGRTENTRTENNRTDARNDNRNDRNRERGGNSGGGGRGRDSRNQPTITDLLREGQEILVQIAKEPIAKKGARITSHIALPGRFLVYMPTIEHLGVSRKIESAGERSRLRVAIQKIRAEEDVPSGGFIVRTAGVGVPEQDLRQDARYLVRTWTDMKKAAEKAKSPALVHQDLDIIQRLLRDQLSDDFSAIRVDSEEEYQRIVEFINRIQPRMVNRVKLYTRDTPILEEYGVQEEIDKALKPRVWLKSGGYLVINQTEALVAIDVNTGKFVGKGNARLEDTITKTNMEAVDEIARQIRLRDLGGIIVLDLIDMEDRRNRNKVSQALQEALAGDKSPTKVLSFNDFGLIIMTRKRVKQSLERTMCAPCDYCEGAGWVKSSQTVCYEILDEARRLARSVDDVRQTTLRVHPDVARALNETERQVFEEIEAHLGSVDITGDKSIHQEQFDFAFI